MVLVLAGCGGGEEASLSLRLLFGANPRALERPAHRWDGFGCSDEPLLGQCLAVRLTAPVGCAESGEGCIDLLDGDRVVDVQGATFDLKSSVARRSDLRLEVGMYTRAGNLIASGEARGQPFAPDGPVVLTLFPVGPAAACGTPGESETPGLNRRAFHTTTLLPDGRLLIVGGVGGPLVHTTPDGNPLEDSVELLDPRTGEAGRVRSVDNQVEGEAGPQIFRAFHQAIPLGVDQEGRALVRLVGGIRSNGSAPSVLLSSARADTPLQLMLVGASNAELAPPVDIHFDAAEGTVTVTAPPVDAPRTSFGGVAALSEQPGDETRPGAVTDGWYFGGGIGSWQEDNLLVDEVEPVVGTVLVDPSGAVPPGATSDMLVGRVGAAALGIGTDEVLFWGGNVWSVAQDELPGDQIAEVHRPWTDDVARLVTLRGLAVEPTAFHAAAVARRDGDVVRFVVAGGYVISDIGTVSTEQFASPPVYVVSYDAAKREADVSAVECLDRSGDSADCEDVFGDIAYATATWVAPGQVLIVGGNSRYTYQGAGEPRATRYGARAVAGLVTVDASTTVLQPIDLGLARYGHTATRLQDGSVLVLGGLRLPCAVVDDEGECEDFGDLTPLTEYEVWNPGLAFPLIGDCASAD